MRAALVNSIWTVLGLVSLAFAALGVILPLLPTTPLVILAAFFFAKGSPRLAAMLDEHRIFGPILEDWRQRGAIAPRYKAIAIGMMGAAIAASVLWGLPAYVLGLQALCMSGAAAYILTRPNW